MKVNELRQKSKNELQNVLQEQREKLRLLSFDLSSGKVKNVREIRKTRKNKARTLTIFKNNNTIDNIKKYNS